MRRQPPCPPGLAGAATADPFLPGRRLPLGGPVREDRGDAAPRPVEAASRGAARGDPARLAHRGARGTPGARARGVRALGPRRRPRCGDRRGGTRGARDRRRGTLGDEASGRAVGGTVERRVLIVAGEASGDRHAARLIEALRSHGPIRARGVTGPALEAAGVERVVPMDTLAVIGFTGGLGRLPPILRALRPITPEAQAVPPRV